MPEAGQWNLKAPETGTEAFLGAMDHKTGMSRAIARQILLQDKRLNLPETVIKSLFSRTDLGRVPGGMDPLDLMKKYYGRSMRNYDSWDWIIWLCVKGQLLMSWRTWL